MDEFELAWDTYYFHTAIAYEREDEHRLLVDSYHAFLENNLNPSQAKKTYIRNKLNKSFNLMLSTYKKQLDSIDDLIKYYKADKDISNVRELDPQLLFDLKNTTSTLVEELKVFRREINEVLR
jgi:hypothetical protein